MHHNPEVFEDKSFSELLKDIHEATLDKRRTIANIITDLRNYITGKEDAVMLAPIIKEYLDVLVRNDEHMVKIATIVQRVISAEAYQGTSGGNDMDSLLSNADRERLLNAAAADIEEEMKKIELKANATLLAISGSVSP